MTLTVSDPKGKQDATSKVIQVGSVEAVFDHIIISPSNATIQLGGSRSYTAEAFDTDGGSMGNVTVDTNFSIAPDGSCNGNTCTAKQPGAHTVTGTYRGDSDDATLTVENEAPPPPPPPPPTCPAYALAFHVRPPASQAAGHQFNVQIRVEVLDGGSSDGPLSIILSLQGGSFTGGETSATWTGQGIVNFNHLTIDEPGSYAISASASCAILDGRRTHHDHRRSERWRGDGRCGARSGFGRPWDLQAPPAALRSRRARRRRGSCLDLSAAPLTAWATSRSTPPAPHR